jgi:hypothetical protein
MGRVRAGAIEKAHQRTPTISDRYADLLDTLSPRQQRAITLRLTTGFYEGWRPGRSEVADLVAVDLGLLSVEESLERQRLRGRGQQPPDFIGLVLARRHAHRG